MLRILMIKMSKLDEANVLTIVFLPMRRRITRSRQASFIFVIPIHRGLKRTYPTASNPSRFLSFDSLSVEAPCRRSPIVILFHCD